MRKYLILFAVPFMLVPAARGQTFTECADMNSDSTINVVDVITMIDMFRGVLPLPPGKGDIDLRQDVTVGDFRYLLGYIFVGYPEGACPPHPPYTLMPGPDSIFIRSQDVPAGSGSFEIPIFLVSKSRITDILLPLTVQGADASVTLDSVVISPDFSGYQGPITSGWVNGTDAGLLISYYMGTLDPGVRVLATAHFSYSAWAGGTVSLEAADHNAYTVPGYVYGGTSTTPYDQLTLGVPVITTLPAVNLPTMSLDTYVLFFETLAGYPDPAAQTFTVLTDGIPFNWFLSTSSTRVAVDKTLGMSGETVSVSPDIQGLGPGTYEYDITVYSIEALSSPATLTVIVNLRQQFPTLDANCDGTYNTADIITQVNYLFKSGALPCNPCDGTPGGP